MLALVAGASLESSASVHFRSDRQEVACPEVVQHSEALANTVPYFGPGIAREEVASGSMVTAEHHTDPVQRMHQWSAQEAPRHSQTGDTAAFLKIFSPDQHQQQPKATSLVVKKQKTT